MGRATYYSPFMLGVAVTLSLHSVIRGGMPPDWGDWSWVALGGVSLGVGTLCQLLMIGAQGLFAQVIPVPAGRSIRGPGAKACGAAVLLCGVLAAATALLRSEQMSTPMWVALGLSVASGAVALLTYIWCWPTAVRDFATDD